MATKRFRSCYLGPVVTKCSPLGFPLAIVCPPPATTPTVARPTSHAASILLPGSQSQPLSVHVESLDQRACCTAHAPMCYLGSWLGENPSNPPDQTGWPYYMYLRMTRLIGQHLANLGPLRPCSRSHDHPSSIKIPDHVQLPRTHRMIIRIPTSLGLRFFLSWPPWLTSLSKGPLVLSIRTTL